MKCASRLLLSALFLCGLFTATRTDSASAEDAALARATTASLTEFVEFLRIPNITQASDGSMRRNADWALAAFQRRGMTARLLENGDAPMVLAQWDGAGPSARTILFYAHMDGQAVFPDEWQQPDPFAPMLKRKTTDGRWEALSLDQLTQGQIDPEWRLFARSAADDKAPILMLLAAIDALMAQDKRPTVNVKVILDSQEEAGSPTLRAVIDANHDRLVADAVVMLDGPMHASARPTLVFGHRGIGTFTLTVFGPARDLHSGHYGNYVPNPAFALGQLLAAMKDGQGRVLIPGFYDGVDRSPDRRSLLSNVPDDEAAMRHGLGIAASEAVGGNYQEAINLPSLNVTAMESGNIASKRSIIPAMAAASFDIRTVPATPFDRQVGLIRHWLVQQGYHLIDGAPTDDQRRHYPKLASLTLGPSTAALMTPLDSAVGMWAARALQRRFGKEPLRIPIMGGTVPTAALVDGLKLPVLLLPLVNSDNNQHAANENLRLGHYQAGTEALYGLLTEPY